MTSPSLPLRRTLIVAPHPDDDAIAAGGLMQKVVSEGGAVRILFVTDGENNPWPQRFMERRFFIGAGDRTRWGTLRREEARRAIDALGLPPDAAVFLGFPDQEISSMLLAGNDALLRRLTEEIDVFAPTLVIAPSRADLHPDHKAISSFVHRAVAQPRPVRPRIVTYVIHGGTNSASICSRVELSEREQERKRTAIACHTSQLLLSRQRFLSHATPSEIFYRSEEDLDALPSRFQLRLGWIWHVLHVILRRGEKWENRHSAPAAPEAGCPRRADDDHKGTA